MDLILFYYFSMLAKYKNFSIAAEEVYLSQSSLSKRIKSLEDKLGVELFIRYPRSIELTKAGQALLPYAQNIARELDVMKRNVGAMADADSVLRISAISFLSYYGVTARIASYINENPNAAVGIKEMSSDLGLSLLQDGKVDAVMMFHAGPLGGAYDIYPMAEEEMVAIMNKDHVLSDRDAVTLGDLESQELILISEHDEPFFHDFVVGELKREGYRPRLHKYRVWIGAIETILKQSQSVALLPRKVAERMNGGGVVYKNIEGLPAFSFSVVTKMNNNKPVFRDFIRYLEG